MAFIVIGVIGFIWMGFWVFMYKKPDVHPKVNKAELDYINQDTIAETKANNGVEKTGKKMSFRECFKLKQTWAFAFGKFMTDGVWWFYLFWTPAYLSDVYGLTSDTFMAKTADFCSLCNRHAVNNRRLASEILRR